MSTIIVFVMFPLFLYYLFIKYLICIIYYYRNRGGGSIPSVSRAMDTNPSKRGRSITSVILRQIRDCERTVEMLTSQKNEKSPAKKGTNPHKSTPKKRKASISSSSSSETEGSMSVYSEDDTAGTSRSSSRSSSKSRSSSTGSSVYGTAPVPQDAQGENVSDLSHSEFIPEYSSLLT